MSEAWVRVCAEGELLPGEKMTVWDGDTPIVVVNIDGAYYALEDRCTHQDFELSAGPVHIGDASIECVVHGARFDVRSGQALCGPAYQPVACFPIRVTQGEIFTRDDR